MVEKPRFEYVKQIVDDAGCRNYKKMKVVSLLVEKKEESLQASLRTNDSIMNSAKLKNYGSFF